MALLQTAQATGIISSLFAFGFCTQASTTSVPTLYTQPPRTATALFTQIFHRGGQAYVPATFLALLGFGYASYAGKPEQRVLYAVAAGAGIAGMPWTAVAMLGGIGRLVEVGEGRAGDMDGVRSEEVEGLLREWVWKNGVRALFGLVSGAAGIWGLMGGEL